MANKISKKSKKSAKNIAVRATAIVLAALFVITGLIAVLPAFF